MKPNTLKKEKERFAAACLEIIPQGWVPVGYWLFERNGKIYDLSAADLKQLERIEREGRFLMESEMPA